MTILVPSFPFDFFKLLCYFCVVKSKLEHFQGSRVKIVLQIDDVRRINDDVFSMFFEV